MKAALHRMTGRHDKAEVRVGGAPGIENSEKSKPIRHLKGEGMMHQRIMNRVVSAVMLFSMVLLLPRQGSTQSTVSGDFTNTIIDTQGIQNATGEASSSVAPSAPALPLLAGCEERLCEHREEVQGGYSQRWAAYLTTEGEGADARRFIELNGKRQGPFSNLSELFFFSENGENVAFAAQSKPGAAWDVYLNGNNIGSHTGLAWATFSWPLNLTGTRFLNQSKAVLFQFSTNPSTVSYFSYREDGEKTLWSNVCGGVEGPVYTGINTTIRFIQGKPAYWAWKGEDKYFVVGNKEHGPYQKTWGLKVSQDANHYMFAGESNRAQALMVDGLAVAVPGEIECTAIGNTGAYGVAYQKDGVVKVIQNGSEWPGDYSEALWHQFRLSEDGKILAGWFRKKDGKWYVVANGTREYGPYESYYYVEAGEIYGLFIGRNGENIGYFCRQVSGKTTGYEFFLNGQKVEHGPRFKGICITAYTDSYGNAVGTGMMGSVIVDVAAAVDAAAAGASDSIKAKYLGGRLCYTEREDEVSIAVVDGRRFGPYAEVGDFFGSPSHRHYAFVAQTPEGKCVVFDGKRQSQRREEIHRPAFVSDTEFAHLTLKDGAIWRVAYRLE